MTEHWWSSQKCCHAIYCCQVPNYKDALTTTKLLKNGFPDWCRDEFGPSKIYLSMFTSLYFDCKHWLKQQKMLSCLIVVECQKMKVPQPPWNSWKNAFPDQYRNDFGSSKIYLSMSTSFYSDWTLAEAAKNAALLHYCPVPKHEDAPTTMKHKKKPSLTNVGMSLDQVKYTYPCLPAFIYDWILAEAAKNAALPHYCVECQ